MRTSPIPLLGRTTKWPVIRGRARALANIGLRQAALVRDRARAVRDLRATHRELRSANAQNAVLIERLRSQIDEIHRVQHQLLQASRLSAIGELAAAVAHQVSNPLTGVLGHADLLLTQAAPDDPTRESLQVIRDEAIRARTVIWALLDFAQPRTPERRPVDLAALARSTLDLKRYSLEGNGIRITEDYADLPLVELDENAIRQVLLNVITNAGQAMMGEGHLSLAIARARDNALITVTDDGVGMSDEVRRRMFEPFFTTRSSDSGRGLGLSVSLGLVESHGGTIHIESAPGAGTAVEIRLPILAPQPAGTDMPIAVVADGPAAPGGPPAPIAAAAAAAPAAPAGLLPIA